MKEYVKCLYYENACFDNPIVTVRDGQDRKHLTLEEVVELLNTLHHENQQLQEKQKHITHLESKIHRMREQIHKLEKLYHYRSADLKRENEQLRKQCFELEKDYVIETSDISDKIYLDDEIEELKQKYGV